MIRIGEIFPTGVTCGNEVKWGGRGVEFVGVDVIVVTLEDVNSNQRTPRRTIMRGSGLIWTIVGILAIIALVIWIMSAM